MILGCRHVYVVITFLILLSCIVNECEAVVKPRKIIIKLKNDVEGKHCFPFFLESYEDFKLFTHHFKYSSLFYDP